MSLRQDMLVALSLLDSGQEGSQSRAQQYCEKLFQFSVEEEDLQESLKGLSQTLKKNQNISRKNIKEHFLKMAQMAQSSKASPFQDIHPEWILEALEGESARVVKLINDKWAGKETAMPPEIASLVWTLIESKLDLPEKTPVSGNFGFQNINWLQEDELKTLFQELGLVEIVKAFQGVPGKIMKPFLARFSLKEATDLRKRIEAAQAHYSEQERTTAQKTILALPLENKTHDEVLYDLGVVVFMKATCAHDASWMPLIYQKFPPALGYPLKRAFLDYQSESSENDENYAHVKKARDRVLRVLVDLTEKGKIRRYWKAR